MTYLQLVNKVLVRLRENEVSTVSENNYSKLIGEYVNDAKRDVQNAWDWTGLRNTLTVDTQANVFNYVLTDADNTIKILDVTMGAKGPTSTLTSNNAETWSVSLQLLERSYVQIHLTQEPGGGSSTRESECLIGHCAVVL